MANPTERITFRIDDQWFYDCLTKIVVTKEALGIKTSISYELIRLAKNGLLGELRGAEMDRKILTKEPPT